MSGTSPPGLRVAPSERFRLAQLARETALAAPGVRDLAAGPGGLFTTVQGTERVPGVRCSAAAGGGYELALQLVCDLVPLPALAAGLRADLQRAARAAGISLESVRVHVAALADPEAPEVRR